MQKLLKRLPTNPPVGGYSSFVHIVLTAALPLLVYVLVVLEFVNLAFAVILLSKWRMFAVKARHWPANIRSNAVDIFVGFSAIAFMNVAHQSQERSLLFLVVILYSAWLLFIKPQSTPLWVGVQGLIAQTASLISIFLVWTNASETALTVVVWAVTYLCARHFLTAFDEAMARASAYVWAFFCAALTWLSAHWLLFYQSISQPALIITVIAYGMAALYYLDHTDRMKKGVRRQFISLMVAVVLFILVFSDWSGDII